MKKTLMTAALALTLAAGSAFAAPNTNRAAVTNDDGMNYNMLYTESSWMSLKISMADLNYIVPGDLSLAVTGLPAGTTIALDGSEQQGDFLLLNVTVERDDTSVGVNDVASVDLMSGGKVLTTFTVPVIGVADND